MPYNMREDKRGTSMSLVIHREWSEGYPAYTRRFTLEELLSLEKLLDLDDPSWNGDGFTEFITGYNCDSYADTSCDIMQDIYMEYGNCTLEEVYDVCMKDLHFQTCYTVYRLWNPQHTEEVALRYWKESCISTLEDIIENEE